jgi:hypothetical protein
MTIALVALVKYRFSKLLRQLFLTDLNFNGKIINEIYNV